VARLTATTATGGAPAGGAPTRPQTLALAVVATAILLGRGWGSWRRLHWEEALPVGGAITRAIWRNLDDQAYGTLLPRLILEVATLGPLPHLPVVTFAAASAAWIVCMLVVARALAPTLGPAWAAVAGLSLALVPLPDVAMQGNVWNSFWPMWVALATWIAAGAEPRTRTGAGAVGAGALLVAASNPIAPVLAVPLAWRLVRRRRWRSADGLALAGLAAGTAFSAACHLLQEPQTAYLGLWHPDTPEEHRAFKTIYEAGATATRGVAGPDLGGLVARAPGTARYVLTQAMPAPWNARLLEPGSTGTLAIAIAVAGVLVALAAWSARGGARAVAGRLAALAVLGVGAQYVLVSEMRTAQYVFVPVACGWICAAILAGAAARAGAARPLGVLPLLLVGAVAAVQTFRDGRDAEIDRYPSTAAWADGLARARAECAGLGPEDVVVISQDETYWMDAPVFVRCRHLD
jgi:hypothetical protein